MSVVNFAASAAAETFLTKLATVTSEKVTNPQVRVMLRLAREGERNNAYLSKELGICKVSVCRVTNVLKERGWLSVRKHPEDDRKTLFRLTDEGKSVADRVAQCWMEA